MTTKESVRFLVRTMYDFQKTRIQTANRLQKKKDRTDQDTPDGMESQLAPAMIPDLVDVLDSAEETEKLIAKHVQKIIKGVPIYEHFLKTVKGCGPTLSAVIIAEIDIHEATTVSKIWQYAGCNPGMVRGHKREGDKNIVTDTLIRGDRLTKGFVAPYNDFLKTKLLGVLADCFIKSRSPYSKYYYDYVERLSNSEKEYADGKKWKDESKAHIARAAKRYMIKMFLKDLYVEWRTLEGLPVRGSYQEEYLGHVHVG